MLNLYFWSGFLKGRKKKERSKKGKGMEEGGGEAEGKGEMGSDGEERGRSETPTPDQVSPDKFHRFCGSVFDFDWNWLEIFAYWGPDPTGT